MVRAAIQRRREILEVVQNLVIQQSKDINILPTKANVVTPFANSAAQEAAPATQEAMFKNFGCKQAESSKYVG